MWPFAGIEKALREINAKLDLVLFQGRVADKKLDQIINALTPPASGLVIVWDPAPARKIHNKLFSGGNNPMDVSLQPGEVRGFTVSPEISPGVPSKATLSGTVFSSSDPTLFTVAPDPGSPNTRGIVTVTKTPATNPDSAVLSATATATEPDGTTTEKISGTATVTVASAPPPPPPAGNLAITWDAATPAPAP